MKTKLSMLLLSASLHCAGQAALPVVKANSEQALILLEHRPPTAWTIDPKLGMDIFSSPRFTTAETVCFKTDIDSLQLRIGPGEQHDFIVLLRGKDSCLTRLQSPALRDFSGMQPEWHDTMALGLNAHNTIWVQALLNGTDSLLLNFDTGSSDLTLLEEVLKHKLHSSIELYRKAYPLQLGSRSYQAKVFPALLSGHGTEGRFGWDLFDGYVVELNYDHRILIVHSRLPDYVARDKTFSRLDIRYLANIFQVKASLKQGNTLQESWFLFDSGYERTAMLDQDLLDETQFPVTTMPVIRKLIMKGGQGNEIPVLSASLDSLQLGDYQLSGVPVQLQSANKPMRGLNSHILGNEVLKRFNVFLDFQHHVVYLKPNTHINDPYIELKS